MEIEESATGEYILLYINGIVTRIIWIKDSYLKCNLE